MKPQRRQSKTASETRIAWFVAVPVAAVAALLAIVYAGPMILNQDAPEVVQLATTPITHASVHERATEYVSYNNSLTLTADQKRVMDEALSEIPAPCCSEFSIATCCCPCNLAKSVWGLTKFLITHEHAGVLEITAAVKDWMRLMNPGGFTGDACTKGHCNRPFDKNGCGGMNENDIL